MLKSLILAKKLTSETGEAISRWIQIPSKLEPKWECTKRPAQAEAALSGFFKILIFN